jgi:hypothetical protein
MYGWKTGGLNSSASVMSQELRDAAPLFDALPFVSLFAGPVEEKTADMNLPAGIVINGSLHCESFLPGFTSAVDFAKFGNEFEALCGGEAGRATPYSSCANRSNDT